MEYKVYYVVPHIKYKRKKRYGFLWIKSKIEEKDFSFLDYGKIILADKNSEINIERWVYGQKERAAQWTRPLRKGEMHSNSINLYINH